MSVSVRSSTCGCPEPASDLRWLPGQNQKRRSVMGDKSPKNKEKRKKKTEKKPVPGKK
jgi:hypothetical protein